VGLANLAAWLGVDQLKRRGVDVELMAEIGLFGYRPRAGEPFIFAGANVPTNKFLTDVMTVLGTLVPGPGTRTVGVVGAGQIDRTGAVNSTYGDDGGFLVGSGGANDVLTGADEVVITVAHDAARLVEQVSYRTCPGHAVSTIVTDLGILERDENDEFVLTALLPTGEDLPSAIEHVRSRTGWDLSVARQVRTEPPPTQAELSLLRAFDPTALFLRARGGPRG
jgi:acyl CoA:acetate/3-ketoacid CoA transferase beta subunit